MNILQKIQGLPETKRKMILWIVVIIIAFILLFFWFKNFQSKIESFKKEKEEFKEKLNLPKLEMPKIEMPEILEEELKKLEETTR